MQRRRLTWTPELAEKYWHVSNTLDLAASRAARRSARHLAFCVAARVPAPARVLVLGDRDLSYCESLLMVGYEVARLDLGAEPRPALNRIEEHPGWLGTITDPKLAQVDIVFAPDCFANLFDDEIAPFFGAIRLALKPEGQLFLTAPNNEDLDQFMSICPATGQMFNIAQRLRSTTPDAIAAEVGKFGLRPAAILQIQPDEDGFAQLHGRVEQLAHAEHLHFGNGGTILLVAQPAQPNEDESTATKEAQSQPAYPVTPVNQGAVNSWLAQRKRGAEAALASSAPTEWQWTDQRTADFWSYVADSPLDDLSFGRTQGEFMVAAIRPWLVPGGRHLDVGAGDGHMANLMMAQGYPTAILEPSAGRLAVIEEKLGGTDGFLGVLSSFDSPYSREFDVILAIEVIEHIKEDEFDGFVSAISRSLKPNGKVIFSTPNSENLSDSFIYSPVAEIIYHRWQHVRSWTAERLGHALQKAGLQPSVVHQADFSCIARGESPLFETRLGTTVPQLIGSGSTLVAVGFQGDPRVALPRNGLTLSPLQDKHPIDEEVTPAELQNDMEPAGNQSPKSRPLRIARRIARLPFLGSLIRATMLGSYHMVKQLVSRLCGRERQLCPINTPTQCANTATSPLRDFRPLRDSAEFDNGPIILCNNALAWGGVERQIVNTLKGLERRGVEGLGLLCLRLDAGPDYDFYLPALAGFSGFVRNAVDFQAAQASLAGALDKESRQRVEAQIAWLPDYVKQEIIRFVAEFLSIKPSVVHIWQDSLSISAGYAARLVGVPVVIVSSRNMAARRFAYHQSYMEPAYRELADCDRIVFVNNSEAGARDYAGWLGILPDRFNVVRNGVDSEHIRAPAPDDVAKLRASLGIPNDAPIVGAVFRLYEEKQPMLWIEAAWRIATAIPDSHFVIFGTGPLMADVATYAKERGFADRLHLPGTIADAALGMSMFNVFMLTSKLEGTPNVVLEASMLGIPVVATNAGGTGEAITEGMTGYVASGSDPDILIQRVVEILLDPHWAGRARQHGPEFVSQRFGLERMLDETLDLYARRNKN